MSYRLELGLALLLAVAIGVVLWAASGAPKAPSRDPRASTFLAGPQGSRALYDVLVRLGRPVERRRSSLFGFGGDEARRPGLLVVLHPPLHLEPQEVARVVAFVRDGGAVLAAGDGGGLTRCAGWRLEPDRLFDDSVAVRPRPPRPGLRLPRAGRVLAPRTEREPLTRLRKRRAFVADDGCGSLESRSSDTLVAARDGRPIVLRFHYDGGGTVTLAADVGWFRNRVWRDTDVPQVVLPLLLTPGGGAGRVVWDEYHQGIGREGPGIAGITWEWLRRSPAGWAILQVCAIGLVWLAVTAVRFGPARSVIERRRRSPLEHLEALAAGLEGAAGADTAVRLMVAGLRRRLSRTGTVTADSRQPAAWLESLELALSSVRGRRAVRALQRTLTQPGGPERALVAAQAVEDVWEELRPRRTPDGF